MPILVNLPPKIIASERGGFAIIGLRDDSGKPKLDDIYIRSNRSFSKFRVSLGDLKNLKKAIEDFVEEVEK